MKFHDIFGNESRVIFFSSHTLLDRQNTQQENERTIVGEVTPELVDGVWVNQGRNKYGKPINLGPVSTSDLTQMDKTMKMNDLEIEGLETTIEMNRLGINPESKKVIFIDKNLSLNPLTFLSFIIVTGLINNNSLNKRDYTLEEY